MLSEEFRTLQEYADRGDRSLAQGNVEYGKAMDRIVWLEGQLAQARRRISRVFIRPLSRACLFARLRTYAIIVHSHFRKKSPKRSSSSIQNPIAVSPIPIAYQHLQSQTPFSAKMERIGNPGEETPIAGRGAEGRKKKRGNDQDEVVSKRRRPETGHAVLEVFFKSQSREYQNFEDNYAGRKVIRGKCFDFKTLGGDGGWNLPVAQWLVFQGWKEVLEYQAAVYPKLVQILLANYNPRTRRTWIGEQIIDLSPAGIRELLGTEEVTETSDWPESRAKLFSQLAEREVDDEEVFLHSSSLELNLRVAHNVVYSNILPRGGSTEQVPARDARILWALKHKKRLDLGKLISDHILAVRRSPKHPLPYGMYFTKFLRKHGVDVGNEYGEEPRTTDMLNETTLKRMGYRSTGEEWVLKRVEVRGGKQRSSGVTDTHAKTSAHGKTGEEVFGGITEERIVHAPAERAREEGAAQSQPTHPHTADASKPSQPIHPHQTPSPTPISRISQADLASIANILASQLQTSASNLQASIGTSFTSLTQRMVKLEDTLNSRFEMFNHQVRSLQPAQASLSESTEAAGIPTVAHTSQTSPSTDNANHQTQPIPGPPEHPQHSIHLLRPGQAEEYLSPLYDPFPSRIEKTPPPPDTSEIYMSPEEYKMKMGTLLLCLQDVDETNVLGLDLPHKELLDPTYRSRLIFFKRRPPPPPPKPLPDIPLEPDSILFHPDQTILMWRHELEFQLGCNSVAKLVNLRYEGQMPLPFPQLEDVAYLDRIQPRNPSHVTTPPFLVVPPISSPHPGVQPQPAPTPQSIHTHVQLPPKHPPANLSHQSKPRSKSKPRTPKKPRMAKTSTTQPPGWKP